MHHRIAALFVMFSVLCHSLEMAAQMRFANVGVFSDASTATEYIVMHWEGTPHHHDDQGDGSDFRPDDSEASLKHLAITDGLQMGRSLAGLLARANGNP